MGMVGVGEPGEQVGAFGARPRQCLGGVAQVRDLGYRRNGGGGRRGGGGGAPRPGEPARRRRGARVRLLVLVSALRSARVQDGCLAYTGASSEIANGRYPASRTSCATGSTGIVTARGASRRNISCALSGGKVSSGTATACPGRSPRWRRLGTSTRQLSPPASSGATLPLLAALSSTSKARCPVIPSHHSSAPRSRSSGG